jgi:hypothetical protein
LSRVGGELPTLAALALLTEGKKAGNRFLVFRKTITELGRVLVKKKRLRISKFDSTKLGR